MAVVLSKKVDPHTPTSAVPGQTTSGVRRPGRHCLVGGKWGHLQHSVEEATKRTLKHCHRWTLQHLTCFAFLAVEQDLFPPNGALVPVAFVYECCVNVNTCGYRYIATKKTRKWLATRLLIGRACSSTGISVLGACRAAPYVSARTHSRPQPARAASRDRC